MSTNRLKRWIIFALVAVCMAAVLRLAWWNSLPVIKEVEATRGSVADVVYATGIVEPVDWAKVVPKLRDRITSHCNCEGKEVRKGDVLVTLDDDEPRAQMAELEARMLYAQRHLERIEELARRNVTTLDSLQRAQSDMTQIRALMAAQKERIDSYQLRAPMDGVVLRRDFEVGEIVSTTDVVAWVGRLKPLRIVAEIAEEDIAAVQPGQVAMLRHDGFKGRDLVASVERVTPKGDVQQKTFRAYLSLADDTPLRVGMSVEANIVLAEHKDVLTLPVEAVRAETVLVRQGDILAQKPVSTGLKGLSRIEIISGLAAGEAVISPAGPTLVAGQRVRLSTESWRAAFWLSGSAVMP